MIAFAGAVTLIILAFVGAVDAHGKAVMGAGDKTLSILEANKGLNLLGIAPIAGGILGCGLDLYRHYRAKQTFPSSEKRFQHPVISPLAMLLLVAGGILALLCATGSGPMDLSLKITMTVLFAVGALAFVGSWCSPVSVHFAKGAEGFSAQGGIAARAADRAAPDAGASPEIPADTLSKTAEPKEDEGFSQPAAQSSEAPGAPASVSDLVSQTPPLPEEAGQNVGGVPKRRQSNASNVTATVDAAAAPPADGQEEDDAEASIAETEGAPTAVPVPAEYEDMEQKDLDDIERQLAELESDDESSRESLKVRRRRLASPMRRLMEEINAAA